jgi:hypothetical protein
VRMVASPLAAARASSEMRALASRMPTDFIYSAPEPKVSEAENGLAEV